LRKGKAPFHVVLSFFGERIILEGVSGRGNRAYLNSSDFMDIIKWIVKNFKTFRPWDNKVPPAIPRNNVEILSTVWQWKNVVYQDKYHIITDIHGYNSWYAYDGNFLEYIFSWQNGMATVKDSIIAKWKEKVIPSSNFSQLKKAIWGIGTTQYYASPDLEVKFEHEGPADIVIRDTQGRIVCGILFTHKNRVRISPNFKYRGYFEWTYNQHFFCKLSSLFSECVFMPMVTEAIWRVTEIVRYTFIHMQNESDNPWYFELLPDMVPLLKATDDLMTGNCYLNYVSNRL